MALTCVNLFITAFVHPWVIGFRLNSNSFNLCKKGPFNRKEMKSLRLKISVERQRTLTLNKTDCFEQLRNSSVVRFCSQNIYMQCWKDKDKTLERPKDKEGSFLNAKLYCERRGSLKKNLKNKWCHSCIFKSPGFCRLQVLSSPDFAAFDWRLKISTRFTLHSTNARLHSSKPTAGLAEKTVNDAHYWHFLANN